MSDPSNTNGEKTNDSKLNKLRTGAFSRRYELAKTGIKFGSRLMADSAKRRLGLADEADTAERQQENAKYLVKEMGKLKGSVVKVGQILATYGEYLFPEEITEALHSLEDSTPPMSWKAIEKALRRELGEELLAELDVEQQPIAAASLGQAHRARVKSTGEELCLKIQYPGVENTIDADLNAVIRLLRGMRVLESTRAMDDWLNAVRELLHLEVDYHREREQLAFTGAAVKDHPVLKVPSVHDRYCSQRVLAMSFEPGVSINSDTARQLPQEQRNQLGHALLELFFLELCDWQRMQSDPNFGNFLVQQQDNGKCQLVLLDFGAMRPVEPEFCDGFQAMVAASAHRQRERFLEQAIELGFMKAHFPDSVLSNFADVGMNIGEPLWVQSSDWPEFAVDEQGNYRWRDSELPKRVAKQAMKASLSTHFALPPTEFMFVIRKLMGVFTLIAALDARFDCSDIRERWLKPE